MKKIFFYFPIMLLCFFPQASFAQKNHGQVNTFNYAEQMPTPSVDVGEYLQKQMRYPAEASTRGIQGRVLLSLSIDSSGNIGAIKVLVHVHPLLDSEAVRMARTLPKFNPGTRAGKRIATNYMLPIEFKLQAAAPQPPRPSVDIKSYFDKNLVYPADAKKDHIQGIVDIKFIIDTLGNILYPEVSKYLYPSCDSEALRLVKQMPRFYPATEKGKPVNVYFEVPVEFSLKKIR